REARAAEDQDVERVGGPLRCDTAFAAGGRRALRQDAAAECGARARCGSRPDEVSACAHVLPGAQVFARAGVPAGCGASRWSRIAALRRPSQTAMASHAAEMGTAMNEIALRLRPSASSPA